MKENPAFLSRPDILSVTEARYYQDLLYRTIKIGTELEFALPKGVLREDFQPKIEAFMAPSKDMGQLGRLGVYNVINEHCGIEVLIIGRHPHWDSLVEQYNQIILPLLGEEIRMRPTCGFHFHLLQVGASEDIPEIILANLWNMFRIFAPGLKFLTSGGETTQGLCRRRQHNAHQEFIKLCPGTMHMSAIKEHLTKSFDVPEHQNFFNLEHINFSDSGEISTFHMELRFPDGDLCPVSITAKTFLFLTMLLKAVEISKFGLLNVESDPSWSRNLTLLNAISNNDGKLATSDTSSITPHMLDEYRDNGRALLRFLKSVFLILDNPAELILKDLVESPISLRRVAGKEWQEINTELAELIAPLRALDTVDHELIMIIELGLATELSDEKDWQQTVAQKLHITPKKLQQRLHFFANRSPVWDAEIGALVFLR
jgi:hypothetical protein